MRKSTGRLPDFVLVGSRRVRVSDVVGVAEIAELLGVAESTAHKYVNRGDFPEPMAVLSRMRVWHRADVEEWAAKTLPLRTGRPRKQL